MKTRKSPIPTLISGSSGKPKTCIVERRCECRSCSASIEKGQTCFEIPKKAAFTKMWRYCQSCFQQILKKTKNDLEALENLISGTGQG